MTFTTYWKISNGLALGFCLLGIVILSLPSQYFGSQGYSGYGWLFVLMTLALLALMLSIHAIVVNVVALSRRHRMKSAVILLALVLIITCICTYLLISLLSS